MPRKPSEIVTETYEVQGLSVNPADAGGAFMLKHPDGYVDISDAKFFVPDGSKVNFWKLVQWYRESKGVSAEVDKFVKKDKVKEVRFSVPELPNQKETKEKEKKVKPEPKEVEVEAEDEVEETE